MAEMIDVFLDKENNAGVFEDTAKKCKSNPALVDAINYSRHTQLFIKEGRFIPVPCERYSEPANIIISSRRTFEAAKEYDSVAVLNFANALHPGGGVAYGARAQEESLCRVSTLYYSLATLSADRMFYAPHKMATVYGTDDILINREIVVIKDDDHNDLDIPFKCTVITCAAPDFSSGTTMLSRGGMDKLYKIMTERIDRIYRAALMSGAENIILGAFGCGVFANPPKMIGYIMIKKAKEYAWKFKNIEFAIYSPGTDHKNIDAFMWAWNKIEKEEKDGIH